MKRGKDRQKRKVSPASLANLQPLERVRPEGMDDVLVRVYLNAGQARRWRRLSPLERGELVRLALEAQDLGAFSGVALD